MIEEELMEIKFANLSKVREKLLKRLLLERKLQREIDIELEIEELEEVSATASNFTVRESDLK